MAVMGLTGTIAQTIMKRQRAKAPQEPEFPQDAISAMEEAQVPVLESEGVYEEERIHGIRKQRRRLPMNEILETSSYFGLALTLFIYWMSYKIAQKTKISFLNPILVASAIIIVILLACNIKYETYETGANLLSVLLTPQRSATQYPCTVRSKC